AAIRDAIAGIGLAIRAGLHTGECELIGSSVAGIAVHLAARVAATAAAGEVLVSSTGRDLVAGSGLSFLNRGVHVLKDVPGEWRLFAAAPIERAEALRAGLGGAAVAGPVARDHDATHAGIDAVPVASLRCEGDYWTVVYGDDIARVKDLKGL